MRKETRTRRKSKINQIREINKLVNVFAWHPNQMMPQVAKEQNSIASMYPSLLSQYHGKNKKMRNVQEEAQGN